jgi:hypothetical protein
MKRLLRIAVMAAIATVLGGCIDSLGPVDGAADTHQNGDRRVRLEQYQQVWSASGVKDYQMTVRLGGAWISGAAVIRVRGGVPVSVTPIGPNTLPRQVFQHYDTVEKLFGVIEHAIEQEADRLEVTYNRRYGFPVGASVDVRFQWADDEHGFAVEDFRIPR